MKYLQYWQRPLIALGSILGIAFFFLILQFSLPVSLGAALGFFVVYCIVQGFETGGAFILPTPFAMIFEDNDTPMSLFIAIPFFTAICYYGGNAMLATAHTSSGVGGILALMGGSVFWILGWVGIIVCAGTALVLAYGLFACLVNLGAAFFIGLTKTVETT